jgi:hypothetical protein
MTKEDIEKEAEEYAGNTYEMCSYSGLSYASDRRARKQAFLAGAEPREKQIAHLEQSLLELAEKSVKRVNELEAQIEKMKCCGNCKHFDFNEPNYCHKGVYRERQYVCSKWELED